MATVIWLMVLAVAIVLIGRKDYARFSPYGVAAILFSSAVILVISAPVGSASPEVISWVWSNMFGIGFDFRLDGLAMVMAVLICFIGAGVFLYSAAYMKPTINLHLFYTTLTIFTVAMIGLVLSDNMLVFFLFWETTSICSFLLVGSKHETADARESARKALFVTVGGGLMLLVAFVLIAHYGHSTGLSLSEAMRFSSINPNIIHEAVFPVIVACVALGIASKSAQVPFHIWLPAAMAGPTPVSSFLHSATMVKAGVFLLARLTPSLGSNDLWIITFTTMGAATMLIGAALSASQKDIKKILAYSTISVLGILVMLLGIGSEISIQAATVFLVAHALYKAALFQIVGHIEHATGSRDITKLGSLAKVIPLTATATLLSVLSMTGFPPFFGFFGKELAYLAKTQMGGTGTLLLFTAIFSNALLGGLALSIFYRPFWSTSNSAGSTKAVPFLMSIVPLVFSVIGLSIGIFPSLFDQYFGSQMSTSIAGSLVPMKLKLWHGFDFESLLVVGLSVLTLGLGLLTAFKIHSVIDIFSGVFSKAQRFSPNKLYEKIFTAIPKACSKAISYIQNGDLSTYTRMTFLAAAVIVIPPVYASFSDTLFELELRFIELVPFLFVAVPALLCLSVERTILKTILLGVSGFGLVISFLISGAPDLALTQLLVECLVLVFVLLLVRSPLFKRSEPNQDSRFIYLTALAVSFCILSLVALKTFELPNDTANYMLDSSYAKAFGKNVVNVILVDFRALDTFGEVVVVAIAALGVGSLLNKKRRMNSNG